MTDLGLLARTYHAIQTGFVRDGRAPHYTDLASALGLPPEEARRAQRELLAALNGPLASLGGAHWAHPDTDYIVGFSPFSNLPTQYAIAVDGQQRWYGQCGLESLAVSWLFPGKEIRIETRCLDCAEPFSLRMRDGELLAADPDSIVGHSNVPLSRAAENWPYTWAGMNLFRSEEHVRAWGSFDPASAEGIMPVRDWIHYFSQGRMRARLDPDFVVSGASRRPSRDEVLADLGRGGPYWGTPAPPT